MHITTVLVGDMAKCHRELIFKALQQSLGRSLKIKRVLGHSVNEGAGASLLNPHPDSAPMIEKKNPLFLVH
jgi:hypothetical protein